MQCTNKLKQLSLACHNMHDTYNHFPSHCCQKELCVDPIKPYGKDNFAAMQPSGNRYIWHNRGRVSWGAAILPFIEEYARYEMFQLWCAGRANSYHSGGVNVALCDASVRFVSDSINSSSDGVNWTMQALTTLSGLSGQSPCGIWGALGTVSCGEAKSL